MPSTKYAGNTGRAAANSNDGSDACTTPAIVRAVGELGPDERRSQRSLQSSDPDRLSRETARASGLPARNESTVGNFDVPFAERRAGGRQLRIDRDASFRERGLLPGQRIDPVLLLDDFEIGGANFVSVRRHRKATRSDRSTPQSQAEA